MSLINIVFLYLAFRVKQVVCDFMLQTAWMAQAKGVPSHKDGWKALFIHASIHACVTLLVVLFFVPKFWWLALVDFCVHGSIDKTKAVLISKKGWTYKDNVYWWVFGLDQEAHNLTHFAYIVLIVMKSGILMH